MRRRFQASQPQSGLVPIPAANPLSSLHTLPTVDAFLAGIASAQAQVVEPAVDHRNGGRAATLNPGSRHR